MKKHTKKVIIGLLASTALFGSVAYSEEIQTATVDTLNFVTNTKVATEDDVIKAKDKSLLRTLLKLKCLKMKFIIL